MGKNPAEQFYWGDWLNDVELMASSACTRGVWITALCRMWYSKNKGEISGSVDRLAQVCSCNLTELGTFLDEAKTLGFCEVSRNDDGIITLRNRRMYRKEKEKENARIRQKRFYEKKKTEAPNAQSDTNLISLSSTSSSTSKNICTKAFEKFWSVYPKKKSKGQAEKAFKKINPDEQLLETIISTIEQATKSDDWLKDGGQFIPYPATWLNAKGWEDEIQIAKPPPPSWSGQPKLAETCELCHNSCEETVLHKGLKICEVCFTDSRKRAKSEVDKLIEGIGKKM